MEQSELWLLMAGSLFSRCFLYLAINQLIKVTCYGMEICLRAGSLCLIFLLEMNWELASRLSISRSRLNLREPAQFFMASLWSQMENETIARNPSKIYSFVSRFGHEKAACTGSRALVSCALTKLSRHWHLFRRSRAHISCEKIAKYHKFVWNYEKSALHYGDFFTWRLGNYSPRESKTSENSKWLDFLIFSTYEIHCDRQFSA